LDPESAIRAERAPSARGIAHVEALLPPSAIAAVLAALVDARPAHEAMACLRKTAPLGDRRLLVGLQELLACGAIARA
jgi:hypothetical protein